MANQTSFKKGHDVPEEWRQAVSKSRKGSIPWNKGRAWSPETKLKISKSKKGKSFPNKGSFTKGFIPWNKGIGDKTTIAQRIRTCNEYKQWRTKVFERDSYTCQECGQHGGNLNAHHIIRYAERPDLVFDVDNGTTMCIPCHRKTPNFGNRKPRQ